MFQVKLVAFDQEAPARFVGNNAVHDLAVALIDEIEFGLIACDVHGSLRYANRSGREELATGTVLKLVGDVVRCADGCASALSAALLEAAVNGRRQLMKLGQGADRLMGMVIPLRADTGVPASVLIMLGRRGPCSVLGLEMFSKVHGLTLTERRILSGLLADKAPRQIAAANGVALSTVRSQIKSIRDKVGVRNIEGLLIRAAEVPPVTPAWRRFGGSVWRTAAVSSQAQPLLAAA